MFANPVLRRELLERWRGWRAFAVITIELVLLSGVLLLLYWAGRSFLADQFRFTGQLTDTGPLLGRFMLDNTFAFALLFVLFIGPGYAAAQIAGERERKTLGLLQITLMGPWSIVLGKLGAASAWLVLLAVATIPLGAVGFVLGGAVWTDLLRGMLYLVIVAVSIAAMGIGISSLVRRTTTAIVLTYGMVLLLLVGTLFGAVIESVVRDTNPGRDRIWSFTLNPYLGLADALQSQPSDDLPNPLAAFAYALPTNQDRFFNDPFGGGFVPQPMPEFGFDDVGFAEEFAVVEGGGFAGQPGVVIGQGGAVLDADIADVIGAEEGREPIWLEVALVYLCFGVLWLVVARRQVGVGGSTFGAASSGDGGS